MIGGLGTTQVYFKKKCNYYGPDIFFVKQSVTVVKQAVTVPVACKFCFALICPWCSTTE